MRSVASFLWQRPRAAVWLAVGPPLLWLTIVYFGSIGGLVVQSFFRLDHFTGLVVREFSLQSYAALFEVSNVDIIRRTVVMAALVSLTCAVLAFPLAYVMAITAPKRLRSWLYLGVTLPLWSSYIVRVYAWKLILAKEGILTFAAAQLGLGRALDAVLALPVVGGPSLSFSYLGTFIVFVYIWLPYMILPVESALQRIPRSFLEASSDLGASPLGTFRRVTLPLALPGLGGRVGGGGGGG
jgi:putative spermidine/putrescine transport system permease protein